MRRARYAKKKAQAQKDAADANRSKEFEAIWSKKEKRNARMQNSRVKSAKKQKTSKSR